MSTKPGSAPAGGCRATFRPADSDFAVQLRGNLGFPKKRKSLIISDREGVTYHNSLSGARDRVASLPPETFLEGNLTGFAPNWRDQSGIWEVLYAFRATSSPLR